MFATIIVVLPSKFTGGTLHLSHGTGSTVVDLGNVSATTTSVAAWYTDVLHEVKPVTSGYRLALSYNVIHTTTTLRPSVSASLHGVERLRHILLSWQQTLATSPLKIIYLLDHHYAQSGLRGSSLKGHDAHLVAVLQGLAAECQIELGLASIECYKSGAAEGDYGQYEGRGRRYYGYDSEDEDDREQFTMGDVDETRMSITGLVDMDGITLLDELEEDEDSTETIPPTLRDEVEDGEPDEEEYEGYQGNVRYFLFLMPSLALTLS